MWDNGDDKNYGRPALLETWDKGISENCPQHRIVLGMSTSASHRYTVFIAVSQETGNYCTFGAMVKESLVQDRQHQKNFIGCAST